MIFSKTSTQILPFKNPKNPETWYVNENFFNKNEILYIVEKLLKNAIQ